MSTETPSQIIERHRIETKKKDFQGNGWGKRHVAAWDGMFTGDHTTRIHRERALRRAITGWAALGEAHAMAYSSQIGDDGVLGPAWKDMGAGLRTMLNGDCGRYDCGTLDALICDIAYACGVSFE